MPLAWLLTVVGAVPAPVDSLYRYTTERGFLRMEDGVRLAVTWWIPAPRGVGERFPALLELIPYRKDDDFYSRDFPLYDYFARRGFLLAKVDLRGTGGSGGAVPPREYSERELKDAVELIRRLARDRRGNGRVGMWGISWGGFNAMQVALRNPPALKAILALHASDDLFHDDVRYIDGALHLDRYALQIDHGNGLPQTPSYPIDADYFRNRFDTYPWVLTYLKQPVDGPFWRANALRYRPRDLRIPAYLIGGLLDGYRDTPIRALAYLTRAPVKVDIGPWNHSWPDNGSPGPNYEWRARAVRWWNHWLRNIDTGLLKEPRLLVFERGGHAPDASLTSLPGRWRFEDWPIAGATAVRRWLAPGATLASDSLPVNSAVVSLPYRATSGTAAGEWWGEPTGDMRGDDSSSATFDSPVLAAPITVIGMPSLRLSVTPQAPLANWSARLEDVGPDGRVSLVTGGVLNGAQHSGATSPRRLRPDSTYHLAFGLHFTTWVFRPGHRIRLAVSNAQFPMIWPSPYPMTTQLVLGPSSLDLPVVPAASRYAAPTLPAPEPRRWRADVTGESSHDSGMQVRRDSTSGTTTLVWNTGSSWRIGPIRYSYAEKETYSTSDELPAVSEFLGTAVTRIAPPGRNLRVETTIRIRSDAAALYVLVRRRLWDDARLLRTREWKESIPREFH